MASRSSRFVLSAVALAGIALVACSSSSGTPNTSTGDTQGDDSGIVISCVSDPRVMMYASGMSVTSTSGNVKVSLMAASPAPPEIELNTWTLSITDANGDAIPGAAPVMVPWMPDHGHGPSVQPTATATGDGKTFKVTDIDLFMAGVWRLTISAMPAAAIPDQVVYFFCIEG
jgi:hypothetical protein